MLASLATELRSPSAVLTDGARRSSRRTVFGFTEVNADGRQLLYALTLSEYLETWVTLADASADDQKRVARMGTGYTIEYRDHHGQTVIIEGVFRTVEIDKVVFTWRRAWPRSTRRGLVTIRLCDGPSLTRVELAHSGVMSDAEHRWLDASWQMSLSCFKSLFDHRSSGAFDSPSRYSGVPAVR